MKKELIFLLVCSISFALISQTANAQSWSITGNNNTTPLSKLGTTNFIPLSLYTNNAERIRIDEIGRVGIGTSTPVNILTVKSTTGNPTGSWLAGLTSPVFVGFADNASSEFVLATASNITTRRSVIQGRRSRGTLAVPTVVINNDYLASFLASGYDGNTFQNPATIDFFVDGVPSAGNVPTRISFVTGSNQATRKERLKVGSTGNINFNDDQLTLQQSTGNVGIGVGNLNFSNSLQTIQFANPGASSNAMINMFASGTVNANRMVIAHSPAYPDWGLQYSDANDDFEFLSNGTSVLHVGLGSHLVGIGTTNPAYLLDVAGRMRIQSGGLTSGTWLTNAANTADVSFVGLPDDNTVGFYGSAGASWGLAMNLTNGNVGVGTLNPTARLQVIGNPAVTSPVIQANTTFSGTSDVRGLASYSKTADGWGFGVEATGGYRGGYFYGDGGAYEFGVIGVLGYAAGSAGQRYGVYGTATGGTFNAAGYFVGDVWASTYNVISDRKFKTDITVLKNPLQQIMKLKPSRYVFKQEDMAKMGLPSGSQLGLIADELKEVFPELVKKSVHPAEYNKDKSQLISPEVNYESVNYIGLIPVLVASTQEQQKQIDLQQAEIKQQQTQLALQQDQINELKKMIYQLRGEKGINTSINSVNLEQNNPNPLDKFTNIRYSIPAESRNAQLIINDVNGQKVKQIQLGSATRGNINFDATGLASGTYTYSIIVDGKLTQSKKMVVAKSAH